MFFSAFKEYQEQSQKKKANVCKSYHRK
ncbi:uncharacterized protein METZ01_LOCUS325016, partial [marine metagenome]